MNLQNINGHYVDLDLLDDGLIIDCGACQGAFTDQLLDVKPNLQNLVLIEPNNTNFNYLQNKYANNDKIVLINSAIVDELYDKETANFLDFGKSFPEWGNITSLNVTASRGERVYYEVSVIKLSNIIKQYPNKKIDFLKLDIEGIEYQLFKNLNCNDADVIKQLSCEVHINTQKTEIVDILSNLNFICEFKNKAELYAHK